MKIFSFQGCQLSAGQRRTLAFQQQAKSAFINSVLAEQVEQTLAAVQLRKDQGVKPERVWFKEVEEIGTLCIAEWMGF